MIAAGAAHLSGPLHGQPGPSHQLQMLTNWSPALSMPMNSRAQAHPSAGLAGAAHPGGPPQEHPGSLHQQLQLPFASTGLSGHQSWVPALSMPMDSRAQAQPSAGLAALSQLGLPTAEEVRLITDIINSLGSFEKMPTFL
ncbi:TPA: hypothetical protein ACH3X1_012305 [Trebouxia sp. C0004]